MKGETFGARWRGSAHRNNQIRHNGPLLHHTCAARWVISIERTGVGIDKHERQAASGALLAGAGGHALPGRACARAVLGPLLDSHSPLESPLKRPPLAGQIASPAGLHSAPALRSAHH